MIEITAAIIAIVMDIDEREYMEVESQIPIDSEYYNGIISNHLSNDWMHATVKCNDMVIMSNWKVYDIEIGEDALLFKMRTYTRHPDFVVKT